MFDMDEFLEDLDEQSNALESMLNELGADEFVNDSDEFDDAMEGFFRKPKPVAKLLESLNKTINKTCKTAEDCDELLEKISAEEVAFNGALANMKEAAENFKSGEITKKEFSAAIKAESKKLKKTCDILKLKDFNDKTDNVTDEEIQALRDFLVGAKEAINSKKSELGGDVAEEGEIMSWLDDAWDGLDSVDVGNDEIAQEVALGSAAVTIGVFALALIGIAHSLKINIVDQRTINLVKKKLKPQMNAAKNKFKIAKKAGKWGDCVKALKEQEKINDQLYAIVKKLTPLKESEAVTSSSDGKTKETRYKKYNLMVGMAQKKYKQEKDYLMKKITLYTEKAKGPAAESASFLAGFDIAAEAFSGDLFDDDDLALESDYDSDEFAGLFDDDDDLF